MGSSVWRILICGLCVGLAVGLCEAQVLFPDLGTVDTDQHTDALGISPDGAFIVGGSDSSGLYGGVGLEAAYWRLLNGGQGDTEVSAVGLGFLTDDSQSEAVAVERKRTVEDEWTIVGWSYGHNLGGEANLKQGFYIEDVLESATLVGTTNDVDGEEWHSTSAVGAGWFEDDDELSICGRGRDAEQNNYDDAIGFDDVLTESEWFVYYPLDEEPPVFVAAWCYKSVVYDDGLDLHLLVAGQAYDDGLGNPYYRPIVWTDQSYALLTTPLVYPEEWPPNPRRYPGCARDISHDAEIAVGDVEFSLDTGAIWGDLLTESEGILRYLEPCSGTTSCAYAIAVNQTCPVIVGSSDGSVATLWFDDDSESVEPVEDGSLKEFTDGRGACR